MAFDRSVSLGGTPIDVTPIGEGYLPTFDYPWSDGIPSNSGPVVTFDARNQASRNAFRTSDQQVTSRSTWLLPTRRVYGRQRVEGNVTWFSQVGARLRLIYEFGEGEARALETIIVDGDEIDLTAKNAGTTYDADILGGRYCFYLGTAAQDVSTCGLNNVSPWTSDTYSDDPNYVVVALEINTNIRSVRGFPRVDVIMQGIDAVAAGDAYRTPVRCLAHWLTDVFPGTTADSTTLSTIAAYQEASLGGSPRNTWGMVLGQQQRAVHALISEFEVQARCWVKLDGTTWYFIGDGPRTVVNTPVHTVNDTNVVIHDSRVRKTGGPDQADDVRVDWFDPDESRRKSAFALGNVNGTITSYDAPHITSYAEAQREAEMQLDRMRNENLVAEIDLEGPIALKAWRGELFSWQSDHNEVNSSFWRIMAKRMVGPARAVFQLQEYLVGTYSSGVDSDPTTYLGNPAEAASDPPTVSGLTGSTEAVGRLARLDVSWTDPEYPWLLQYKIDVYDRDVSPDQLLSTTYSADAQHSVSGLPADVNFRVDVTVVSQSSVLGTAATANVDKPALPTPGDPTDVRMDVLEPVMIGDRDGLRVRVRWTDPDYRAWIGFRLKQYSASGQTPTAEPIHVYNFAAGGEGVFDLAHAPIPFPLLDRWTYVYAFQLHAVNAAGDESTGVWLYGLKTTGFPPQGFVPFLSIQQTKNLPDSSSAGSFSGTWREVSDDGSGNYVVSFGVTYTNAPDEGNTGAYINVYECDSGGNISSLRVRIFVSTGRMLVIQSAPTWDPSNGGTHPTSWPATPPAPSSLHPESYGIVTGDISFAANKTGAPTVSIAGDGTDYFRYTLQITGHGDQVTDEVDMTEHGGSATVHGPL